MQFILKFNLIEIFNIDFWRQEIELKCNHSNNYIDSSKKNRKNDLKTNILTN